MKKTITRILAFVAALVCGGAWAAKSISINFCQSDENGAVTADQETLIGLIPVAAWNNTAQAVNGANTAVNSPDNGGYNVASLKVYDGTEASADSTKAARFGVAGMNNVWFDKTSNSTLNGSFLYHGLCHRSGNNDTANILYTNSGTDFACYDVIVYMTAANANNKNMPSNFTPISINGNWYKGDTTAGDTKTIVCESNATWGSTPVTSSNWKQLGVNAIRVNGLHGSLRITKAAQNDCGIAAIQIVENTTASALTNKRVISIDLQSAKSTGGNMTGDAIYGMEGVPASSWVNDGCAYVNKDANKDEDIAVTLKEYNGTLASPTTTDVMSATLHEKVKNAYSWDTATDPFLKAYCDDSPANIYVRNVPYSKYDVIVYCATDTENRYFGPVTVNGVSYKWANGSATVVSSSLSTVDTRWGYSRCKTSIYGVNTIRINNLTGADLSIMGGNNANNARGGIAAIQIVAQGADRPVEVYEPTPGNSLIGSSAFVDTGIPMGSVNLLSRSRITGILGVGSVNGAKYKTAIGYNTQKIGDVVYTEFQIKDDTFIKAVLAALKVENGTVRIKTVKTSHCDATALSVIGTPLMTVDSSGNVTGSNLENPVGGNADSGYGLRQIRIDTTGRTIFDNTNDGRITGSGSWNLSKILIPASDTLANGTRVTIKSISLAGMTESQGSYATKIKIGETISSAAVVDTQCPWPMGTDSFKVTYVFASGVEVVVGTETDIKACDSVGTETTTRLKSSNSFTSGNTYITFTDASNWPMYEIETLAPTATITGPSNNLTEINWNGGIIAGANIATLTIEDGAELVLNGDISANLIKVIGTGDLELTGENLNTENFAKLDFSGFGGKIIFRGTDFVPDQPPAAGVTYRFEGSTNLPYMPLYNQAFDGTIEIARGLDKVTNADPDTGFVEGEKGKVVFDTGFTGFTLENCLSLGASSGANQNFVQKAGTITLTREGNCGSCGDSPFIPARYPVATVYDLKNGSILAVNGKVQGWDGHVTMTIGDAENDSAVALFKAKGIDISRASGTSISVVDHGTLEIGDGGLTLNNSGNTLALNGGTLKTTASFTANVGGSITVGANGGTVEVAADTTLTISSALTITGTLTKTGTGTLILSNVRDFTNITIREGNVKIVETAEENLVQNAITITGLPEDQKITAVRVDGTEIEVGNGQNVLTPIVKNSAALYDWTFLYDRNLSSTGKRTDGLSWDTGYTQSNGFTDNHDAIKTPATPYSNFDVTYPTEWTCVVAGVVPNVDKGVLITFGTMDGGLIGLAAGTSANEVILVRTTGNSAYSVIGSPMTVTNARETRHTYGFVKTPTSIIVYLDGKYWAEQAVSNVTFGNKLQVGSVHGGVGNTGLVKPTATTGAASTISAVRIFDCQLSEKAIKEFAKEFPYTSLNGTATRIITADDNWVKTDAWTLTSKEGTVTQADKPNENQTVVLTTEGDVTINNNLTAPASYEKLTINGTGTVTVTADSAEMTANTIKAGQVEINTTVKILHGALDLTGGPTTIGANGKLIFDFSSLTPALVLNQPVDLQLTGVITRNDEKIQLILPEGGYPSYITAGLVYEGGKYYFRAKRNTTELYWKEGSAGGDGAKTAWTMDTVLYVDQDKTIPAARTANDTVVIDHDCNIFITAGMQSTALKIQVTHNAAVFFGRAGDDTNNKNIPSGSTLTIDSGSHVEFGYWHNATKGAAILGNLTINGEGTWSHRIEDSKELRIEGTVSGTARLTGNGKLVYSERLPADSLVASFQANTWTGSVYLKKCYRATLNGEGAVTDSPQLMFNNFGNADSTVISTGNQGWPYFNTTFNPTIELVDADGEIGLWVADSSDNKWYSLKLKGAGTFKVNSKANSAASYLLRDVTQFTGNIIADNKRVYIGNDGTRANDGKIVVNSGNSIEIGSGKTWTSAGGVEVAGTITGAGTIAGNLVLTDAAASVKVASVSGSVSTTVADYVVKARTVERVTTYSLERKADAINSEISPESTGLVITIANARVYKNGSETATGSTTIPNETGRYTVKQGAVTIAEIGVIAVDPIAKAQGADKSTTPFAVPFKAIDGSPVTVARLLNTMLLNPGDQLHVFSGNDADTGKQTYQTWTLTDARTWDPAWTVTPDGPSKADLAERTTLNVGSAAWVTTAGQIVVYGQYGAASEVTVDPPGVYLLGNTAMVPATPAAEPGDFVEIPGDTKAVRQYEKTKGGWKATWLPVQSGTVVINGKEFTKWNVQTTGDAPSVLAGRGYFLKRPVAQSTPEP